jgi:GNAT superfamily N-acetyltransferase
MSERSLVCARTYLEMRNPSQLSPASRPVSGYRVERVLDCPPSFWRFLYTEVGRDHRWVDRLPWSADEIRAYLADPSVSLWLMTVWGAPAGYFELRRDAENGVEIVYFGVLKEFNGRGFGGHLLTQAVQRAWEAGAARVWVHTNTLDHPSALPNYLKRGFSAYKTEEFIVTL